MSQTPKEFAYEGVAAQIRQAIVEGKFVAGQRLPPEEELAESFGVSRSTVREAIRSLSSQGFLQTKRGAYGGSSVRRYGHPDATLAVGNAIALLNWAQETSVDEILQARQLFEVPASRLAASRRSAEHLAQLRSFIPPAAARFTMAERYQMNISFHNAILDATGNRLLRTMVRPLFDILPRRFTRELAEARFWDRVVEDHKRILRAIDKQDPESAGRLMDLHLARVRPTYESIDVKASRRGNGLTGRGTTSARSRRA